MNTQLFSLLIAQIIQVTVLVLVVWFAVRLFAKNRPHLAHSLWVLVLIKCITPPIWSSPTSPFSWMTAKQVSHVQLDPLPAKVDSKYRNPGRRESYEAPIVVNVQRDSEELQLDTAIQLAKPTDGKKSIETGSTNNPIAASMDWRVGVFVFWLVGSVLGLMIAAVRFAVFSAGLQRCTQTGNPEVDRTLSRLCKKLGVRRRVRIRILDSPVGPAVLGLFRPTILLPAAIVHGKSAKQLEPLIAHELIHLRRGDLVWALVQTIATSAFWFHPLVWLASKMVTRESERSCDEETVTCLGCRPATYARGLLEILEQKSRLRSAPALPGVRPVDITSARLERVMKLGQGSLRRTPVWVWLAMLFLGLIVLPGAAMVFAQDEPKRLPMKVSPQEQPAKEASAFYKKDSIDLNPGPSEAARRYSVSGSIGSRPRPEEANIDFEIEIHEVGDLLAKVRTFKNLKDKTAEQQLMSFLPCRYPGAHGLYSTPGGNECQTVFETALHVGVMTLGHTEPTMKIVGDKLYVFEDKSRREATKTAIERFRAHGFDMIVVETRFVSMAQKEIERLEIDWQVAESGGPNPYTAKQASGSLHLIVDQKSTAATFLDSNGSHRVQATSFVEKSTPVLYSEIGDAELQKIIQFAKGGTSSVAVQAPTVTMFNGQNATVNDMCLRPFVVGYHRVANAKDANGKTYSEVRQPIIRTVPDGTSLNLRATANAGIVKLDTQVVFTKVRDVEEVEVAKLDAETLAKVQVPEVATTRIQSSLDVADGQTLALRCLKENDKGKTESFIVMLTCRVLDGGTPIKYYNRPVKPAAVPAKIEDKPESPVSEPESSNTRLIIRASGDSNENDLVKINAVLKAMDVEIDVDGAVHTDVTEKRSIIRGQMMTLSDADNEVEFKIEAKHGELEFRDKEEFAIRFEGEVKLHFYGSIMTADKIYFDDKTLLLEGAVKVDSDEAQLSAERVRLSFVDDGMVTMKGNARLELKSEGQPATKIHADRIEWNPSTNSINATQ